MLSACVRRLQGLSQPSVVTTVLRLANLAVSSFLGFLGAAFRNNGLESSHAVNHLSR